MNAKGFCNTACLLAARSLAGTAAAQNTSKFAFNVGGGRADLYRQVPLRRASSTSEAEPLSQLMA